jgi:hypothetical protein
MLLFAKKNHLSSTQPELPCPSRLAAHITQEVANAKRQVFGTQQVWPSTKARCRAVDFLRLKAASARFPARKIVLKSRKTMVVR